MEIQVKGEKAYANGKRGEVEVDKGEKWRCNGGRGGTRIMMGFKERAFAPLIAVSLEELVPQDHFYRHLQIAILSLHFFYGHINPYGKFQLDM